MESQRHRQPPELSWPRGLESWLHLRQAHRLESGIRAPLTSRRHDNQCLESFVESPRESARVLVHAPVYPTWLDAVLLLQESIGRCARCWHRASPKKTSVTRPPASRSPRRSTLPWRRSPPTSRNPECCPSEYPPPTAHWRPSRLPIQNDVPAIDRLHCAGATIPTRHQRNHCWC